MTKKEVCTGKPAPIRQNAEKVLDTADVYRDRLVRWCGKLADAALPRDERHRFALRKWLAICGRLGIGLVCLQYLSECFAVVSSLKWLNIWTPPEWLDLSQHMMVLPLSMMVTFIYVLHVFSPAGRHERRPEWSVLHLPVPRHFALRLGVYLLQSLMWTLLLYFPFVYLWELIGYAYGCFDWGSFVEWNRMVLSNFGRDFLRTAKKYLPLIFAAELVWHETAMFLYRRQLKKLNAEENDIR